MTVQKVEKLALPARAAARGARAGEAPAAGAAAGRGAAAARGRGWTSACVGAATSA